MPPAIIGAAIAMGAAAAGAYGVITITTAMVIATLATVAGSLLTKQKMPGLSSGATQSERKQVLRASAAAKTIIYGTMATSGVLFFAEEEAGDQDDNEWVHLAIALCGHAINGVNEVYLGDEPIGNYSGYATYEVHSDRQTVDPFMLENCPSWKEDMIGKGITWIRISLMFDRDKFPSGLPNVKVILRGKEVFDPRTGLTVFSDNSSLVIRDYISWVCEVPNEDLDDTMYIEAANISDEMVQNADGTSERRYRTCYEFDATDSRSSILDTMCESCSGEVTYIAGKFGLMVGAYYGPATMVIDEDQITSGLRIIPETAYSDKVNTITGIFVDPGQDYNETDYPAVAIQEWIDEDGNEFTEDLALKAVPSAWQAQRLARIKLNRKRMGRTIEFTTNMFGYRYRPGQYVYLNMAPLGIEMEEFRITNWVFEPKGGCRITMRHETVDMWNDAAGKPMVRPDLTNLPKATIPAPTQVAYATDEVGDVVQGRLSWKVNSTKVSYNEVVIRELSGGVAGAIVVTIQVPGNFTKLNGLVKGAYRALVVSVGLDGVKSEPGFTDIVIQAPDAPTSVNVTYGYFSATLVPQGGATAGDSVQYDFWTSGLIRLPDTTEATVEAGATRLGSGLQWTRNNLLIGQSYWWYIRSVNIYGASSFIEVQVVPEIDVSEIADEVTKEILESDEFKIIVDGAVSGSPAIVDLTKSKIQQALAVMQNTYADNIQVRQFRLENGKRIAEFKETIVLINNESEARAQQITELRAQINEEIVAQITQINETLATLEESTAQQLQQLTAQLTNTNTRVDGVGEVVTELSATVTQQGNTIIAQSNNIAAISSRVDGAEASVQQLSQTVADTNGTVSALYTARVETNNAGQKYVAGMQLGAGNAGSWASFLVDQFTVMANVNGTPVAAFTILNGQTVLRDALIGNGTIDEFKLKQGTIQNAVVAGSLQSANYQLNARGFKIDFANERIEINGSSAGNAGRAFSFDDLRIVAYDDNGNPAAVMGEYL